MTDQGAIRPEDVLPDAVNATTLDGVDVRKGTVAAFIANARLLEATPESDPRHAAITDELRRLAPGVRAVGVLDIFTPRSPIIASILDAPASD